MQVNIRTTRTIRVDQSIMVSDPSLAPGSTVVVMVEPTSSTGRRVTTYSMAGEMNLDAWEPFSKEQ